MFIPKTVKITKLRLFTYIVWMLKCSFIYKSLWMNVSAKWINVWMFIAQAIRIIQLRWAEWNSSSPMSTEMKYYKRKCLSSSTAAHGCRAMSKRSHLCCCSCVTFVVHADMIFLPAVFCLLGSVCCSASALRDMSRCFFNPDGQKHCHLSCQ